MNRALMTRKEVMECMNYKSVAGFLRFTRKYTDFPPVFTRSDCFNSRIFYVRSEVKRWLQHHGLADALA